MEGVWRTLCIGVLFTKECEWILMSTKFPALLIVVFGNLTTRYLKFCLVQATFFLLMPFLLSLWRVSWMAGMLPAASLSLLSDQRG